MKLIIDISQESYNRYCVIADVDGSPLLKAIKDGIPLDEIRAEIEEKYGDYDICEWFENYDYEENDISEYRPIGNIADILQIIDGHKSESEEK